MAVLLAGLLMFGTAEEAKAQCTVTFTFCPSDTTFYPPFPPQTCTQIVNWNTPTAENNGDAACGSSNPLTVTQVAGPSPGTPVNVGVYTIIYHAFDANGASASCSFVVTVADTVPPTITGCPADQTKDQEADTCGAHATWLAPVASDACGIASFTANTNPLTGQPYASGDFFPVGTTTVIYTATDNSGNTTTCGFDITVNDTSAPAITFCPGDVTQSNDPDSCNAFVTVPDVEIDEDCPATVTYTLTGATTGGPFAGVNASGTYNVGVTTVTFNVDDGSGGTASCSFTVTVEDTQAPVFTVCQADTTVFTSDDGTGDCTTFITTEYEFSENCPGTITFVEVFLNGSFYASTSGPVSSPFNVFATLFAGINDYTVIITDVGGNSDTCTHTVTVIDDEAPAMACSPSGATISTDDTDCFATVPVTAGATDNCAIDFVVNDYNNDSTGSFTDSFPPGSYTITFTAHDTAGNTSSCEATFTVEDDDPPVFTGCVDQTFSANDEFCGDQLEFTAPTVADNCGVVVTFDRIDAGPGSPNNFGTFPVGTTTVTYFAEDDAGNTATCSFDIIVEDNAAPDVVCPGNVNVNNDPGTCEAVVSVPTFNSTCVQQADFTGYYVFANWTVNTSPGDGSVTPGATTSVTLVSSDNGNGVSTRMNRIIQCNGTVEFDWDYLTTDPDGPFYDPFGYWLNGTFVQLTANGGANAQSGTESIVVSTGDVFAFDQQSDDGLFGPATTTITNFEAPIAIGPSAVDNCGIASIENDFNNTDDASDTYPVGTTTVTWTITDVNGNVTTCSHDVTVNDTEVPVITCDPDKVFNTSDDGTGDCSVTIAEHVADWTDNCDVTFVGIVSNSQGDTIINDTVIGVFTAPGSPIFFGATLEAEVYTVYLEITDPSGNSDNCSLTITVIDDENPSINCPADITTTAEPDTCGAHIAFDVTASDNCYYIITNDFNAQADTNQTQAFNDFVPVGVNTIVFTVTDSAGNTATCDVEITITDDQPPTVICPQLNDQLTSTNDVCYAVVGWADPTEPDSLFDNCAGPIFITQTTGHPNPGVYAVGTYTVEYLAEDQSGNTATCSFTFSVIDTARPEWANCPNDTVVFYDSAQCGQTVVWQAPTPSDNCVGVYDSSTHVPGDFFPVGTTTVVYTAYDSSGNTSQCSFTVTVVDTVPPTIVCQSPDTTLNTDPGECTAVYFYDDPVIDDDCGGSAATTSYNYPGPTVTVDGTPDYGVQIGGNTFSGFGGETVQDVNVTIEFLKTDGSCGAPGAGCSFHNETNFRLTAPGGQVILATPATWAGCDDVPPVTVTFDQSAAGPPAFAAPVSGTFQPNGGNLDALIGSSVDGTWYLEAGDNAGLDPLCVISYTIEIIYGDSTGNLTVMQISGLPSGSAFPLGTTTNTFIVTDSSGNTATCSFDVTVEDNEDPVFTSCPADMNVGTDPGDCYATVNYTVTATDNCAVTVTQTSGLPSGSQFPIGTTTNSFIATDTAGNTATCSFDVTVTDDEPPTISNCPNDTTVPNEPDMCSAAVSWTAPTVFDNCGIASWTSTHNPGDVFPVGTTTVVYTAEDIYGNTAECTFDVTVEDVQDPIIVCRDTVFENDPGKCYSTQLYDEPYFEDNCPGAYLTHLSGPMQGDTLPVGGPYTVEYMVTDTGGNTATCSFTITVLDTENPTTTCPNDTVVGNDPGVCGAEVTYEPPFPSDNCIVSSVTQIDGTGLTSGDTFPVGVTNQLYVVEDGAGNTITCGFTVTVLDTEAPIWANCPADITVDNDPGDCGAIVNYTAPTVSDNCGATTTSSHNPGDFFPVGTTTVTYTAVDTSGNSAECSFTVTVEDTEDPEIDCPADITVSNDPGVCEAVVTYPYPATSDNCFMEVAFYDFETGPQGWTTGQETGSTNNFWNVYNTTAASGNNSLGTANDGSNNIPFGREHSFMQSPPFEVNGGMVEISFETFINNEDGTTFDVEYIEVSTDGGATWTTVHGVPEPGLHSGVTTSTWTPMSFVASGAPAGTQTMFRFRYDTGDDFGGAPDPAPIGWYVDNVSISASSPIPVQTAGLPSGSSFPVGTTTNEFIVTDNAGNTATCSFDVTVEDNEAPVITGCPADITVSNDAGNCSAVVSWTAPTVTDNCAVTSWTSTHNSGDVFPVGTTSVVYTAEDAAGNVTTCGFDVTVEDNEAPVASCPADMTVSNDPGNCDAVVTWSFQATDNCGVASINSTHNSGDVFPIGTTTVMYTVEDVNGNTATCSFDVTVEDNEAPTITCPADMTVSNDPGVCGAVVNYSYTASDNCPGEVVTITSGMASGSQFPVGTTTVTLVVTDASGNTAECSFDVTVEDNEAPTVDCPADTTLSTDPGVCETAFSYVVPFADNCPDATISYIGGGGMSTNMDIDTSYVMYASSGALGGQLHRVDAASGSSFVVGALGNYGPVRTIDWDQGASIAAGTGGGACNSILIDKWTATETLVGNDPNCVQSNFSYEWINGTLYAVQIDTNTALETIHVQDFTGQNGKGATGGTPMTIDLSGVNWTIDVSGTSMPNSSDWFRVENERMEANDVDGPAIWYSEAIDITTYSSVNFSLLATETGDLEPTDYMDIAYSTDGGSTWTMINNWNGLGSATHTFVGDLPDDDDWESETVSVSGLSGSSLMVRVTMFNDNDSPGEPMQIDDLMVTGNPYWVATLGTVSGGALTPVATITPPNTFPIDGMAYNPNTDVLYTIAANDLYTLNRNTGALTFVGSTGAGDLRTLDYNPGDGMLYAGSHSGGIYTIDPGTGAATLLSSTGLTISSLTWVELITISSDVTVSGTYPLGTTTEEFFVVDASGNTTSCSFTITVEDNELPTISCPADINVYAGPDQCDALVNYVTPIISDNCPGASVSLVSGLGSGSMFPVGTTTELWMVTDGSGNTATCSFTVSVADTQAPTIQCVPDITVANDTGLCGATVAFTQTIVLLEQDFESWPCCLSNPNGSATYDGWFNANGFTTPDWSVDNNGTSSGFTGPSVDHTLGTSSGMYVYLETSTGAGTGSFDMLNTPAIDLSTVSTAEVSFWYHMYGASMGTLRLEASANGSTWTQVFSISGPQHFSGTDPWTQATVNLNAYAGGTVFLRFVGIRGTSFTGDMAIDDVLVTGQQGITIADNCPGATFTQIGGIPSGGFFPVGTTTNTFMVTDASGNTGTCSFDVTVEDTEPPVFTSGVGGGIPVPTTLLDEDFNGCAQPGGWTSNIINGVDPWLFGDNGGDNLDGTCMAYFDDDALGSGAAFSTVELVSPTMDMTNIVIGQLTFDYNFRALGSSSFTVDGWDGSAWVNLLTETSNNVGAWSSGPPYAAASISLAGFTNPDFQLRFEYHDGSTWAWYVGLDNVVVSGGIFMECEQDSITVFADSALCGADVIVAIPTAMDNCAIDTITNDYNGTGDASDFYPVGTTTVTWTAYDESGNTATCTQVITVIDDQDPTIACPADIVVANDSGSCNAFVTVPAPVTTDNCTVTVTNDYNGTADASDVYPVGTTTVVFTVVDEAGNTATCSMEITVEDTEVPTITCPNDLTVPTDPGLCGAVVIYNFPTFNDNCPGATVTLVQGQGPVSLFPVGTTTNIFRVEDAAGNTATCSFTVTVEDTEAPTFIDCPTNIIVSNDPGDCGAIVTWIEPTAIDNCPNVTVTGSAAPGDFFPLGTTTVVYTATDDAGNTATCAFSIIVQDTEDPVITGCPADIQSCDPVVTWTAPTATDNCNVASFTSTHTSGSTFPIGTTTVVYTATDDAGNVTTCGFDVTIHPLPTADAGPDVDVCTGLSVTIGGNPTASGTVGPYTYSWAPAGSLDDPTLANPSASPTATTTYTVTITDANGCTDTDEVTVTVNPLPTADAGADQAICLNESTTIGGNPTASGTVGPYTYSWAPATGLSTTNAANPTASPTATITYTVTVTDANGCESTDVVTVTVNPLPDATITPAGSFCENDGSQTLTAATAGGTWSGNGITNASAGTFNPGVAGVGTHQITYTVTDANGCSNSATTLIEVLAIPDARILPAGPFCEDDDPVFLTGLPNITPSTWSGPGVSANGQFDPSAAGAGSHVITYMVTNANGCSDTTTLTIVVNAMPSVVLQTGSPFCELDPVVTFTASVPGGIWSGPGIIQPQLGQFLPIAAGAGVHDIDYTVTNANGCTVTETVLITVFEVPAITSIVTEASCSDASDGEIKLTVTGGTQPYTYAWSNGATTKDVTGLAPGTYTVTVTEDNGCSQTASITVGTSTTPVVAQAVIKPASNSITANGEIKLNVSGGVPPYDFLWSNGEITKDIDSLLPGNYTVVIIDDAGCSYTFTYNVPGGAVGIDLSELDKNIRLFPNPTSDVINIEIEVGAVDADMTMTVYDVLGRKLYEVHDGFSGAYQHQIDMQNWASGHYMIRFDINSQYLTKKFILAK